MSVTLSPHDWHKRYLQQAQWTRELRRHLYSRLALDSSGLILDVGCGTGALATELEGLSTAGLVGLDINASNINMAMRFTRHPLYIQGDAHQLPFPAQVFAAALCHFLLLWVADPAIVIHEMVRVTRPGGAVLALAEPDYGGRIDYPFELASLGDRQSEALRQQGANPLIGRMLAGCFRQAGLLEVETGVLGGQWTGSPSRDAWEIEWQVLEDDLRQSGGEMQELQALKETDWAAWQRGERVLFVPTFYAFGVKPSGD